MKINSPSINLNEFIPFCYIINTEVRRGLEKIEMI